MPSLRSYFFRLVVRHWVAKKFTANSPMEQQRKDFALMGKLMIQPMRTKFEPVDAGGVPAAWVAVGDTAKEGRVLLYLHGGGYFAGSPTGYRDMTARISRACGMKALVLDYRLAPEHPFPAAVEDAVAAYRWLLGEGYSPEKIAIAGDSAGGGLTIATLVSLRDHGDPLPGVAVCISPWTDLEATGETYTTLNGTDPFLNTEWIREVAKFYIGTGDPRDPLISPVHASLDGLPPLLIQVGSDEILLSDSTRLADNSRQAGVEVQLDEWEGMWHVWHLFAGRMPEGRRAVEEIGAFITKHMPE